jgi:hypothetical protein
VYVELFLNTWNETNLIVVYDHFNVLLSSVCKNFIEDLCVCVQQGYWSMVLVPGYVLAQFC